MMMRIKDRFKLKIESIAFGGEGVGRRDGLVIFVPFAAPDEVVEIEIVQCKKTFARGRLLEVLTPSPFRTSPFCRYFSVCGGCAYQHIRYDRQLAMKRRQVEDAFVKIGKLPSPRVEPVIGSSRIYAYRGKATLHAGKTVKGFQLGFMDVSGGALTDIGRCEIMHESINDQIRQLRNSGTIRLPEEDVMLWSDHPYGGDANIIRNVKDKQFLVPRDGFFQANLYLTDRMVDEVCRLVEPGRPRTIVDACSGCGLFSLFLSPYASRVIGVEINKKSVHCAKLNAESQGVKNAEFIRGDISDVLKDMEQRKESVDVIVVDPPRTGLETQALAAISGIKPADIIYISCNPATQARDVARLRLAGYELHHLQPLDMFPQTQHIETIALLKTNLEF